MSNILCIKVNDRPVEQAVSVQMYETFVKTYTELHPEDHITELDLYKENLPYYGNTAITALYKENQGLEITTEEKTIFDLINGYLTQFLAADKIVFAFPLWNYTAPAPLTTYLSYLAQAGVMFKYTAEGPIGLVGDKKVMLLNARGGVYSSEPMASLESALRFIKANLNLWGITPQEVIIESHNAFPDRSSALIEDGLQETAAAAAKF
ncbi:FMN-dependent NADH-azoreductase [Paenibacillus pini]|uniref:FMN dependent NADH:quinone oxidoreductase n=1 Tax=Paenibacillus pini JCM 16418 TaxID=1236976 RepID=W7YRX1_9BACL|nr:FMN-dependent NADH-azoreductase [Paenibacillus pini]GAF07421.1 FMN-dependent NADH-azoreductase [Paenibacillus pini JCM 16418]